MNSSFVVAGFPIGKSPTQKLKVMKDHQLVSGIAHALRVLTSRLWVKHLDQSSATHKGFSKMWLSFSLAQACHQRMWHSLAGTRMCDKVYACLFPDRACLYQPSPQEMTGCLL